MFDKGLFGGMFDFNNDGKLDSFEKAAEFATFMLLLMKQKRLTALQVAPSEVHYLLMTMILMKWMKHYLVLVLTASTSK